MLPLVQKEVETPELEKGAIKAVQDLYDVVRHDVLSINMRFVNLPSIALSATLQHIVLPYSKCQSASVHFLQGTLRYMENIVECKDRRPVIFKVELAKRCRYGIFGHSVVL